MNFYLGYFSPFIVLIYSQVTNFEDEKDLLDGLARHDPAAIEVIYRENFSTICSFVQKNGGYSDDAQDIFQEAMVVLFENAKNDSFELTCRIKTYLYSVCRRLWLKKVQRERRMYATGTEVLEEIVPVEDDLEVHEKKDEDLTRMQHALEKMGEPCKSLLEAFYIHRKSMPEIADFFGYTNADNAKTQKYKCLVRLKKIFFLQNKNGE